MRPRKTLLVAALLAAAAAPPSFAADPNRACALVTPDELAPLVGEKVMLKAQEGLKSASMCTASAAKARVLLRVAATSGNASDAAKAGAEIARQSGAQVEVKTFGPVTCSSVVPPESLAAHGYNTTCSVVKGGSIAAVEITAKAKADQVSIERLRPLAERMASRF